MNAPPRDDELQGKAVLKLLMDPAAYPHTVGPITHIETHISDVFLTGNLVYKVKKPLNLGFLDFSTQEKRRYFCEEEVRLNSRFAPGIYLGVVGIHDGGILSADEPATDTVLEYAVQMRQFDRSLQFDILLARDALTTKQVIQLAVIIARFHEDEQTGVCPPDGRMRGWMSSANRWRKTWIGARPCCPKTRSSGKCRNSEDGSIIFYRGMQNCLNSVAATGLSGNATGICTSRTLR